MTLFRIFNTFIDAQGRRDDPEESHLPLRETPRPQNPGRHPVNGVAQVRGGLENAQNMEELAVPDVANLEAEKKGYWVNFQACMILSSIS